MPIGNLGILARLGKYRFGNLGIFVRLGKYRLPVLYKEGGKSLPAFTWSKDIAAKSLRLALGGSLNEFSH